MKKFTKILVPLMLLLFGIGFIIFTSEQIQKELGLIDSSALLGGELERGYPSAGFLISYGDSGALQTCGFAVINETQAITASHCVDGSKDIYIGKDDFNFNNERNIKVGRAIQKEGWVSRKERSDDFAILNFTNTGNYFQAFAQVASPAEGCNLRVIAYGRTENPSETFTKPRKSGVVCASEIKGSTFFIRGEDSGICFGDSGSPVYINGSETVVGVVASIVLEDPEDTSPCAIGNTAIVVRVDANKTLLEQNLQEITGVDGTINVNNGESLVLEVKSETILERLGLSNLSERQRYNYIFYSSAAVLAVIILGVIFYISRTKKSSGSYYE